MLCTHITTTPDQDIEHFQQPMLLRQHHLHTPHTRNHYFDQNFLSLSLIQIFPSVISAHFLSFFNLQAKTTQFSAACCFGVDQSGSPENERLLGQPREKRQWMGLEQWQGGWKGGQTCAMCFRGRGDRIGCDSEGKDGVRHDLQVLISVSCWTVLPFVTQERWQAFGGRMRSRTLFGLVNLSYFFCIQVQSPSHLELREDVRHGERFVFGSHQPIDGFQILEMA